MIRAGDRVHHGERGAGTVLSLRFGYRARVRFDSAPNLPVTVRRKDLRVIPVALPARAKPSVGAVSAAPTVLPSAGPSAAPSAVPATVPSAVPPMAPACAEAGPKHPASVASPLIRDRADLRQAIEALRLGVVPSRFLRDYTVGRDREIASLERLLAGRQGLRAVWGDYGQGKTHLLELIDQMAREHRFVTARITLDPVEFPPSHPKRLYRAVASALTLPESGLRGMEHLMRRLAGSADHRTGARSSRFFSPYLRALHSGNEEAIACLHDYVLGNDIDPEEVRRRLGAAGLRRSQVLKLSDFRTYGRMYIHMIGTLACWARDAGYQGLLLLCDEVEGVDSLDSENLSYALGVLKHFAAVTLPRELLAFNPADARQLYRGGQSVHRRLPLRFRADQPLCVVFALTPLESIHGRFYSIVRGESLDIRLSAIGRSDVRRLIVRVAALYQRAYPETPLDEATLRRLGSAVEKAASDGGTQARDLVRGTVFYLDRVRFDAKVPALV